MTFSYIYTRKSILYKKYIKQHKHICYIRICILKNMSEKEDKVEDKVEDKEYEDKVNVENKVKQGVKYKTKQRVKYKTKINDEMIEYSDNLLSSRLPKDLLFDKIKGMVYGCLIGEMYNELKNTNIDFQQTKQKIGYLTNQMIMSMETIIEKTDINPYLFLLKLHKYHKNNNKNILDIYTNKIVKSFSRDIHPRTVSINQYIKYSNINKKQNDTEILSSLQTNSNITLTRIFPLCLFYDFDDYSIIYTMITHADPVCLVSSILLSTIIRNILINETLCYQNLLNFFEVYIQHNEEKINFNNEIFESPFVYITKKKYPLLDSLQLNEGNIKHAYKTVAVSLNALFTFDEKSKVTDFNSSICFNNILSDIYDKKGDTITNCTIAGAVVGCHIGYNNLPTDIISNLDKDDKDYIDKIIDLYIQTMGLQ